MEKLVETLGIAALSKSQVSRMAKDLDEVVAAFRNRPLDAGPYTFCWADAIAIKVREGGRVVNAHGLIAVGVNNDGHREILGLDVTSAEDGAGWLAFFRSLTARGLTGVQLVTSDAHRGLVDAIAATLPGASWQRCRTHYLRDLLTQVPKSQGRWVATMVRTIFDQPGAEQLQDRRPPHRFTPVASRRQSATGPNAQNGTRNMRSVESGGCHGEIRARARPDRSPASPRPPPSQTSSWSSAVAALLCVLPHAADLANRRSPGLPTT